MATPQARVSAFLESMPHGGERSVCGPGMRGRPGDCKCGEKIRGAGRGITTSTPLALLTARTRNLLHSKAEIRARNFFQADLSQADYVFCYLFPDVMHDLSQKLKDELKPGARAASANFPLPGWSPYLVVRPKGALNHDPIYLYEVEQ